MKYVYHFIRYLVKIGLHFFWADHKIEGKEHIDYKVPTIVVSNHPNTMFDVLNGVHFINNGIKFLANASLFKSKFNNWFFTNFFCIPVQRPQDIGGNRILNNDHAFDAAIDYLRDGGYIYIAPEGTSFLKRQLLELKTGTARIGLQAVQEMGEASEVHILPIGINYTSPTRWAGASFVKVGPPIKLSQWRQSYEHDPYETVRIVTNNIKEVLDDLCIDADTDEEEKMLCFDELTALSRGFALHNTKESFQSSHQLLFDIRSQDFLSNIAESKEFKDKSAKFTSLGFDTIDFQKVFYFHKSKLMHFVALIFFLLISVAWWPIFMPLHFFIRFVSNKIGLYIGYLSTAKLVLAMVLTLPGIFFFCYYDERILGLDWPWSLDLVLLYIAFQSYKWLNISFNELSTMRKIRAFSEG